DGTLLYIGVEEGKAVPVDAVIGVIGKEGEDYKAALEADAGQSSSGSSSEAAPKETATATQEKTATATATKETAPKVDLSKIPATVIRMPALSDTMTEGIINKWNFKVGDKVKSDDSLADVETDKATMEVVGYEAGTLLYIGPKEGEAAPVNGIIAIVGKEGTDITPLLQDGGDSAQVAVESSSSTAETTSTASATATATSESTATSSDDSRVKASPLARKIAKDKGINLNDVKGSAEGGRIIKKDVEEFKVAIASSSPAATTAAASATATKEATAAPIIPQYVGQEKYTDKPVSQMRKTITRRLSESFLIPHFYVTITVDMDQAVAARAKMNDFAPVKISFNDLVLKACAVALKQHPAANASWMGESIRYNEHVNIGVAVAVDEGLLVPTVRFADGKSLSQISAEVKDFAQRAKAKKLQLPEMEGSTFTISNLGMFGVDEFTAIINPPAACILAVSGIQQIPVVKNGAVVPGNVMKVTLTCDHRVVDGATGSAFLQTLKTLLEEPVRLLV
ncbi:MAG: pyruvate dehydrogenase, partial [Mucilaginibacter sp.]|nr:pyruvate dehydrogenase [Mucilaginibacter sp.]